MTAGDLLLQGTAWLALAAWAAGEWARSARVPFPVPPPREAWARGASTLGLLALGGHSLLAFHLRHGWSHAAALADTARQTAAVTGHAVAGGLYVNYAFLALWTAEVAWWWRNPAGYRRRPAGVDRAVRWTFLFMFVNGAIVFGRGPVRVLGALATLAVGWAWYRGAGARDTDG